MISIYLGAENIALTQPQKDAFRETLRHIGPVEHPQPAELMHWRTRLDGNAVIMRSQFKDADLTTAGLRQLIATVLGVPVAQISAVTSSMTYKSRPSPIYTIAYNAVAQMRFILYGGISATIDQSNVEVLAYLKINAAAWGDQ